MNCIDKNTSTIHITVTRDHEKSGNVNPSKRNMVNTKIKKIYRPFLDLLSKEDFVIHAIFFTSFNMAFCSSRLRSFHRFDGLYNALKNKPSLRATSNLFSNSSSSCSLASISTREEASCSSSTCIFSSTSFMVWKERVQKMNI